MGNYIHDSLDKDEGVIYIGFINNGAKPMTAEQKKQKILSCIAARGWFTCEIYWNEACELRNAGLIKQDFKYTTGGNLKPVWVAA